MSETEYRPLARFLCGCTLATLRSARKFRPKLIVAGSGLTAPLAWLVSHLSGATTVVYLHGLDLVIDNRIYRWLWLPMIRRMHLVLVNSRNTGRLAERAGLSAARIHVLNPGTDVPGGESDAGQAFRKSEGLGDRLILLSVGRLTRRKGLAEFVEHVLPKVLDALPDTVLLVIGEDASDALQSERGSQLARIRATVAAVGAESAVRFLSHCDEPTLAAAYRAADLHVFPVLEVPGDVEGFGMVAVEAAAHGLPTVAFDVGGVGDAVVPGTTGDLIPAGDYAKFAGAVLQRLQDRIGTEAARTCRTVAVQRFGWDRFEKRLRMLIGEMAEHGGR